MPEPAPQQQATGRASVLVAIGIALWVGVSLLALVAYPLLMTQRFGGTGTIIALGVALGWIALNAVGWFFLR
jgi:hypothetical protein